MVIYFIVREFIKGVVVWGCILYILQMVEIVTKGKHE